MKRRTALFSRLHKLYTTCTAWNRRRQPHDDIDQARQLIRAIDAGGIPLNAARINHIARNLGLEVSTRAMPEETIARIRAALTRT